MMPRISVWAIPTFWCFLLTAFCGCDLRAASTLMENDTGLFRKPVLIISGNYYYNKFVRHTPKLTTRTGQIVPCGEIGFRLQTMGNHDWQVAQRFPGMGASVIWLHPGDGAHGNLIGLFPHLTLSLARFKSGGIFFRVGSGLGWATRPFNTFTNPGENALGSHWNNITQFRLEGERGFGINWRVQYGVALTHFSNGGFALPNFGMNIPGAYAGVAYAPGVSGKNNFPVYKVNKRPDRRWGATLQSGLARIEYISVDGPKYAIWMLSGALTFKVHRFNRLAVGLDWEKNNGVKSWLLNNTLLAGSRSSAEKGAQRMGLFLADEFFYGQMSIYLQVSYHTGKAPFNSLAISRNYNKLGFRYYFPVMPRSPVKPFIGVSLKAYKAVAEHIALHAGLAF